ncbi:uncharacterized protein PpBr36_06751 [Pyricularia pennisetigena]|uniref:uncharacterized protein n=1 Tax=Pyricularia pennisetigena TaxID=1578925 RepID=UPI00114F65AA|nr:uncharacterized protein PpBr36_06751 [Pyricularia pennisetigena]TLS23063.1 hypothetical protein PpBr36_06751 [Pyricularia pennisetigena]
MHGQQYHYGGGAHAATGYGGGAHSQSGHGGLDSHYGGPYVEYDYEGHSGSGHGGGLAGFESPPRHAHSHNGPSGHPHARAGYSGASSQQESWQRPQGGYFWEPGAPPAYGGHRPQQGQGILSALVEGGTSIWRTTAQLVSEASQNYQQYQRPQGSGSYRQSAPSHGMHSSPSQNQFPAWAYASVPGEGPPGRIVSPSELNQRW